MPAAEVWLGADARSAGAARRFLAATLREWRCQRFGEDAVLLLSELVTNAALHARTQIGVRVEWNDRILRLSVTDNSAQQPTLRHYSDEATTGRGLALVSVLASRWGVDNNSDGTKTVWAEVSSGGGRGAHDDQALGRAAPGQDPGPTRASGSGAPSAPGGRSGGEASATAGSSKGRSVA